MASPSRSVGADRARGRPWSAPWSGRHRRPRALGERPTELPARADAELGEHLAQMPFDGARADEQLRSDLLVRLPFSCESRYLRLLGGELVARLGAAPAHRLAGGHQLASSAVGE